MATNDFIGFASSGSANVMSQADYAAAHEQLVGVQPGMASSAMANKVWRQGANMAAALGDLMSAQGYDALDDGDISKLTKNLSMAVALAIEYKATYDFKSGSICRYNGDLYIALIDNGPSSSVKAPTDVTAWAKIILITATQSAAGYMSAADKTALDALGTLTTGTVTRLLDTSETTNSTIYKIGHVGFMYLADNFPSVNAAYTYYNVASVNIIPKTDANGLCFDGQGNFAGLAWINTNGAVFIRTLASAPGHSFMRCGFTFPC